MVVNNVRHLFSIKKIKLIENEFNQLNSEKWMRNSILF